MKMTYDYDKLNRLQQVTDAYEKIISRRVYDANGNVVKEIDVFGKIETKQCGT